MYFKNVSSRWLRPFARLTTTKTVFLFYCLISPTLVWASIACSLYRLPELQRLCESYDQQFVHEDVPGNDLNKLRDSWGNNPGLHILPPGQYQLSQQLDLVSGQAIVPNPTTILPDNELRTIELVATSSFTDDSDSFSVLKLNGTSSAGGIEIHALNFPVLTSEGAGNKSLVSITSADAKLMGSYLLGDKDHAVDQLASVQLTAGDGGADQPVLLERNWLDAHGAEFAVAAKLNNGQRLTVKNSIVFARKEAGLQIEGGVGVVLNSDIVVDQSCGECVGIRFNNSHLPAVIRTAFWATAGGNAIDIILPEGQGFDYGFFKYNAFSPHLTIASVNASESPFLFSGREFISEDLASGFPANISVADFLDFPGDRGVTIQGSQFLNSDCLFNNTGTTASSLCFQKNAELNKSVADLYFAPDLFPAWCYLSDPDKCIDPSEVVGYMIPAVGFTSGTISLITIVACYYIGKRARVIDSVPRLLFGSQTSLESQ